MTKTSTMVVKCGLHSFYLTSSQQRKFFSAYLTCCSFNAQICLYGNSITNNSLTKTSNLTAHESVRLDHMFHTILVAVGISWNKLHPIIWKVWPVFSLSKVPQMLIVLDPWLLGYHMRLYEETEMNVFCYKTVISVEGFIVSFLFVTFRDTAKSIINPPFMYVFKYF